MIKVTIAIALYNNYPYVEKCIKSVLNQTYSNLDILIVNDGSTDKSYEACEKYLYDSRVRLISKSNGGLSSTRQVGLDEALGEYICFIDADDYLMPTYVSNLLNKIYEDNSDVCVCGTKFIDYKTNNNVVGFPCYDSKCRSKLSTDILVNKLPPFLYLSDSWNKMYRIVFLRTNGLSFTHPKGYNGSDTAFNHKVALHEPVFSTISSDEYIHVLYPSSATNRKHKKLQESVQYIIQQLIEEAVKLNKLDSLYPFFKRVYMALNMYAFQDIYKECGSKGIKDACIKHLDFVTEFPNLEICVKEQSSFSYKVFSLLIKKCQILLPSYFWFRNLFLSK